MLLLLVINVHAFAQSQEAFFSSDSAGIKNIATLIIENTKNKYHLEKVISGRQNVEYWYRYDPQYPDNYTFSGISRHESQNFYIKRPYQ